MLIQSPERAEAGAGLLREQTALMPSVLVRGKQLLEGRHLGIGKQTWAVFTVQWSSRAACGH